MSEFDELVGALVTTARAHHAATGGPNPRWAEWYAEHLIDEVNRILDAQMSIVELTAWLEEADRRYRGADQEMSWPKAYATWLLAGSEAP
jgi:hypothetical protein